MSPWAADGEPVAYVPLYDGVEDDEDEPAVVRFRRTVDRAPAEALERAALPVAGVDGPVVLVSGREDRIWPSTTFGETLGERFDGLDRPWSHAHHAFDDAGHAITVPYEPLEESVLEYMGGSRAGTLHAASVAWERSLECLRRGLLARE